jgi:hypothetical protein
MRLPLEETTRLRTGRPEGPLRQPEEVRPPQLEPSTVDAALADEALLASATRGSRREMPSHEGKPASRRTYDAAHPAQAAGVEAGEMIQYLAEQLATLQRQQEQIRRLLESIERGRA